MTTTAVKPEITTHTFLSWQQRPAVWGMYAAAFEPLRKLAAQRHVMFHDEYDELMSDRRVTKILATNPKTGTPAGIAVVTNDLRALPLVEPEYFATLEPRLHDAGHIWYVAFVCVRQSAPRPPGDTFARLIDKVAEPIRPVRGVCYMDYAQCRVNQGLPERANDLLLSEDIEAEHEQVDAQTFWAYYPGGRAA